MRDIELIHGWHEPLKSYMRLLFRRDGRTIRKAAIRVTSA